MQVFGLLLLIFLQNFIVFIRIFASIFRACVITELTHSLVCFEWQNVMCV